MHHGAVQESATPLVRPAAALPSSRPAPDFMASRLLTSSKNAAADVSRPEGCQSKRKPRALTTPTRAPVMRSSASLPANLLSTRVLVVGRGSEPLPYFARNETPGEAEAGAVVASSSVADLPPLLDAVLSVPQHAREIS